MARLCENVTPCPRAATTTVPAFMGVVRLCGPCAAERTCNDPSRPRRVMAGDYVRVHRSVGRVDRITPDGWYAVECVVRGRAKVRMVSRGMLRPV